MFITSKNKYLSNNMKIFGTCSIHLSSTNFFFERSENANQLNKIAMIVSSPVTMVTCHMKI